MFWQNGVLTVIIENNFLLSQGLFFFLYKTRSSPAESREMKHDDALLSVAASYSPYSQIRINKQKEPNKHDSYCYLWCAIKALFTILPIAATAGVLIHWYAQAAADLLWNRAFLCSTVIKISLYFISWPFFFFRYICLFLSLFSL